MNMDHEIKRVFVFSLQSSSNLPPSQKKPSIDRTPSCSDQHHRNPPLRSKPVIAAFLSDPASSDFATITVDCSSDERTTSTATTSTSDQSEMGEKQQWTNEHLKCLLDTCTEEVESVGRKGLSLQKDSWIRLGRVLKEKFGGHPKAATLRTIPLPFPDLCARLFDGNSATGNFRSYSTQSSSVAGSSSCRVPPLQITATPFDAMDDAGVDTSHHEPPPSAASPSTASPSAGSPYTTTPSGNPNKRAKLSTPVAPSASPSASSPDGTSVTTDDLALEMKKALQSLTKGYTIP
ncbi:unnamed protein product [Lactuca saligna]|uniref:Myb/SANT-like domain-containing protein n=1 Tax=Lactuca saligna TaxID=75948 RepID=A0AA35Z3J2_LACSI|nr:unnamed protein product [Lactuca saligna]